MSSSKARYLSVVFGAALVIITSGCAGARLDRVEKLVDDVRTAQNEQSAQLESVTTEVAELRARLEELEFSQKKRIGTEVDSIKDQLSSLKRRVPPPASVPAEKLDDDEQLALAISGDIGERMGRGLQFVREGNFAEAVPELQSALDGSVGKQHSANILFWLGVSYDGLADNRNALLAYGQIVSMYPKHPIVPSAMLRQARLFEKAGDNKAASIVLKKLVADYPKSSEAIEAKDRLKRIS